MFAEIPTVYSASRHEEPVSQAPAAVTIITRNDIRKFGYRTLAQALASVPGFYVSDDRGYTYLGVRGMGLPTDYNVRVLFLINGLPVNDKFYGGFPIELTPDLLDTLDHIEVVKGPLSVLYGSNALFATINLVTRKGADVNGAVVSAEAGNDPWGRGVFTYGGTFTNGADLFLGGHYEYDTGEQSLSFGPFGSAPDADGLKLGDAFLSATYQDFFVQLWYADRKKTIPTGQFGTIVGDDRTTSRDSWYLAELRWQHEWPDDKTVMLRAYYENYPYEGIYAYDDPVFTLNTDQTVDRWVAYEAQFNWKPLDRHQLTIGSVFEYHWTRVTGRYTDAAGHVTFNYPGIRDAFPFWAVYAQDKVRLHPQLTFVAGGRYDAYPDIDVDRATPQLSLIWNATKDTTLKLLYGQAFRAPSQYELDYPAGSGLGPPSPGIDPESIQTYEMVVEHDFHRGLFGRLSVFRNNSDRLIGTVSDAPNPVIFGNLFNVETTGVEAEFTKKFASGVRGFANATWQASDSDAGVLINSPEWTGNLGLVVPVMGDKLSFALRENFVSRRATRLPGQRTGETWVTDLTVSSDDALPGWSFLLGVQNLFDQRHEVPAGNDGTLDVIPQRGVTVFFRSTYRF